MQLFEISFPTGEFAYGFVQIHHDYREHKTLCIFDGLWASRKEFLASENKKIRLKDMGTDGSEFRAQRRKPIRKAWKKFEADLEFECPVEICWTGGQRGYRVGEISFVARNIATGEEVRFETKDELHQFFDARRETTRRFGGLRHPQYVNDYVYSTLANKSTRYNNSTHEFAIGDAPDGKRYIHGGDIAYDVTRKYPDEHQPRNGGFDVPELINTISLAWEDYE